MQTHTLGYPQIGGNGELKKVLDYLKKDYKILAVAKLTDLYENTVSKVKRLRMTQESN